MDTQKLVEEMIGGSEKAFEDIVEIYYGKAIRLAYLISGNYADSQDIVQETFISCYKSASKIREPQHFENYLNKTLTRKAWEICKKRKYEHPVDEIFDESIADSFSLSDDYIQKEENHLILKTIMSLPI
ncbi:MAG: RNA polymerase sigma factor, partial [Firmicutes bacterium]|nr:RNA polymerase sigma factor [Bacillota bacterium]